MSEIKLILIKTESTRNSKCKYKANNRTIMHTLNYRVIKKYIDKSVNWTRLQSWFSLHIEMHN